MGCCVESLKDLDPKWRQLAFQSTLTAFFEHFPSQVSILNASLFDIRASISKSKFEARISLIHALAHYFNVPETMNSYFLSYIDALFVCILGTNSHPFLNAAVLNALCSLGQTNRNRRRIEMYYRLPIQNIIDSHEKGLDASKPALQYLVSTLNKFVSYWYPLPTDSSICFTSDEIESQVDGNGYALKRLQYLLKFKDSDEPIGELLDEEKQSLIQKGTLFPYNVKSAFNFQVNNFQTLACDCIRI